jgi:uncharacterized Ntn-hydrolase superfamily protein
MPFAGHCTGDGVSCQANIMASEKVWPANAAAFSSAEGSLTVRLLAALVAAETEGGDIRSRQSAAILVVPAVGSPSDTVISLRVEEHPDPLRRAALLDWAQGRADRRHGPGAGGRVVGDRDAAQLAQASGQLLVS